MVSATKPDAGVGGRHALPMLALICALSCGGGVQEVAPDSASAGQGSASSSGDDTASPSSTSPGSDSASTTSQGTDGESSATSPDPTTSGSTHTASGGTASGGDDSTSTGAIVGETTSTSSDSASDSDSTSTGVEPGTTGGVSGSTTDEPSGIGYPPCPTGDDATCPQGYNCIPIVNGQDQIVASYCGSTDCQVGNGADCEGPTDGDATPQCLQASTPVCTLTCGGGEDCPIGMTCIGTGLGNVCAWP